jgi:transposase-like protein
MAIIECFIDNNSANECATLLGLNYLTIAKKYQKLRLLLITHSEALYAEQTETFSQYDEYYYLPTCKRGNNKYLFDSIGILGMVYGKRIHTLLLPDQFAHLKNLDENSIEKETYARYLNQHKMAHYKSFDNALTRFWKFLENWMDHFKGVSKENFMYYLKEAEFKFNYDKEEQRLILETLWKKNLYM